MRKKLLSAILSLCMILSIVGGFSVTASATDSNNHIYIDSNRCRVGGTISIPVRMETNDGIACLVFAPEYDHTAMTLTDVTCNIGNGTFLFNEDADNPKFIWYNTDNQYFTTNEGDSYFIMTFDSANEVTDGTYTVDLAYSQNDICNENGGLVSIDVVAGGVTIFHFIIGDVNDDLSIDGADVVKLARYLVGMETEVGQGADVNRDGSVDGRDIVKLARYMVELDIIEDMYN